jgi:signal transduction histidine kinase
MPPPINQKTILQGLMGGFGLVMVLLSAAAFVTLRRSQSIQEAATASVREHLAAAQAIDQFQLQQEKMGKLLFDLLDSESYDRALAQRINVLQSELSAIATSGSVESHNPLWRDLRSSALAFTATAGELLSAESSGRDRAGKILEQHYDRFVSLAGRVVKAQAAGSAGLESQIQAQSGQLGKESLWLLGACLALSLAVAIATVGITARSFQTMRWQAEELSRVSWHMLQSQEDSARRFSHEMHDELGQSLTGLKAVLQGMQSSEFGARRADCIGLLDEAIGNVRELSQLLRPVVLDDFGLDAALRWLAERFQGRTRIRVVCESTLRGRLPDQTETHLFRITQEALTNVARHSGATEIRISITEEDDRVRLIIEDNGRGLPANSQAGPVSLGMVGMHARARQIGGELRIEAGHRGGVRILASVPTGQEILHAEEENARSASGRP